MEAAAVGNFLAAVVFLSTNVLNEEGTCGTKWLGLWKRLRTDRIVNLIIGLVEHLRHAPCPYLGTEKVPFFDDKKIQHSPEGGFLSLLLSPS